MLISECFTSQNAQATALVLKQKRRKTSVLYPFLYVSPPPPQAFLYFNLTYLEVRTIIMPNKLPRFMIISVCLGL